MNDAAVHCPRALDAGSASGMTTEDPGMTTAGSPSDATSTKWIVVSACCQRSQVFCVGDARSGCEYRSPAGDRPQNTEKSSTGNFFVRVCLACRSQGVVSRARQHVRTLQENAQLPRRRLARGKSQERRQYRFPPPGGASSSSGQFGAKPGNGLLAGYRVHRARVKLRLPSIRFHLPRLLDFAVCVDAGNQPLKQARPISRGQLKNFGFQNFQVCAHGSLRWGKCLIARSLPQSRGPYCQSSHCDLAPHCDFDFKALP